MKRKEHKERFALTLLFAFVIFCILLISVLFAALIVFVLNEFGVIAEAGAPHGTQPLILMTVICLLIGVAVAAFVGRVPLRPLNRLITQMNRLASGDYRARLSFGRPIGTHPSFVEITESFNKMAEELESTEMLRSDFINNFSHEFKTPIVSIAGFAKLLKRGDLSPEQQREYLDIIEVESLRLAYMATNVLDLTKVENQTILSEVSTFNLSEQLRSCVLLLENKWTKKEVDFDLEFGEFPIQANEELLKQVWINLLDNAIKFSPEGGMIEVKVFQKEDCVGVSVINSGNEIPPQSRKKIFNKFYQVDESHASEGNGIGLAIVKRVVELHQGTVELECGGGLVAFTVMLPNKN